MSLDRVSGTEGYAEEAPNLVKQWAKISFADHHGPVLHLVPTVPGNVVDIGAGTGGDAAAFAAMGQGVVAVEPTDELRLAGMRLHRSDRIEWLNDRLPDLALLLACAETFDLVMLTAVWMHLDEVQRRRAMANVATLMRPGGKMIMSLRHGPVPQGRRMFEVSARETIGLAQQCGLIPILNLLTPSIQEKNRLAGVTWTRLAFSKNDNRV